VPCCKIHSVTVSSLSLAAVLQDTQFTVLREVLVPFIFQCTFILGTSFDCMVQKCGLDLHGSKWGAVINVQVPYSQALTVAVRRSLVSHDLVRCICVSAVGTADVSLLKTAHTDSGAHPVRTGTPSRR